MRLLQSVMTRTKETRTKETTTKGFVSSSPLLSPRYLTFFIVCLFFLLPFQAVDACSLQFTSPADDERGAPFFEPSINVSGKGSGTADAGAVGQVTATINGIPFFQHSGQFNRLINFLDSGAARVNLVPGKNHLRVIGSVGSCSASDSMTIYYEPKLHEPKKEQGEPKECTGNPINVATGNKYQSELVYAGNKALSIPAFDHVYNSQASDIDVGFGYGWTSSLLERLVHDGQTMLVKHGSGKSEPFRKVDGRWQGDADTELDIVEDATGFTARGPNARLSRYNLVGQLERKTDRTGRTTHYHYNAAGLIDSITGAYGHTLQMSYSDVGRLASMTDPADQVYRYGYDSKGNLVSVTYPDDTPADATDNPTRLYHYEDTRFVHHLTGITDENNNRYATYTYDAQGRAISSEHAGGVERVDIVYHADGSTTVTDAMGKTQTYYFETHHGVTKTSRIEGEPRPGCADQNRSTSYDANGFMASRTDFNGNTTNYINDSRGLETSRTEAVGTALERTIITAWHPTLRLPIKITEPGKITTFTYDAEGRLLERNEAAAP